MNHHLLLGELVMSVVTKAPVVYPIFVPTKMSLHTFNFYLVEAAEKLLLIDAGVHTDKCWNYFQEVLTTNKLTVEDIDAIILTHHHEDHTGLVNRIREIKDIPLYAHEKAVKRLKRDNTFLTERIQLFAEIFKEMGCGQEAEIEVDRLEKSRIKNAWQKIEGEIIPITGGDKLFGFYIIETPGHASDHIMLYHAPSQVAFVGDQFIAHSSTNALIEMNTARERTLSLITYEQSLRDLLNYPMSIAYSGHGAVMEHPHEVIKSHLQRIESKSEKVLQYLYEEKTVATIAKEMYGKKYEKIFTLVMSDVVGHIDRLERAGKITKRSEHGIFYYKQTEE